MRTRSKDRSPVTQLLENLAMREETFTRVQAIAPKCV